MTQFCYFLCAMSDQLRPEFWKNYPLNALNTAEWEALCDGCGLCCLVKLEDEDTQEVAYTKVACKLLDCNTARCSDYANRFDFVPDCIQLTPEKLKKNSLVAAKLCLSSFKTGQKFAILALLKYGLTPKCD